MPGLHLMHKSQPRLIKLISLEKELWDFTYYIFKLPKMILRVAEVERALCRVLWRHLSILQIVRESFSGLGSSLPTTFQHYVTQCSQNSSQKDWFWKNKNCSIFLKRIKVVILVRIQTLLNFLTHIPWFFFFKTSCQGVSILIQNVRPLESYSALCSYPERRTQT